MSQLYAYEKSDIVSSNNEVIPKTSSACLKSESKMAALRRSLCLMLTIFHIEATLETIDSDKLSKHSS